MKRPLGQRLSGEASHSDAGLVSIGLPVRNGAASLEGVVKAVLAQNYEPLELVISDNASTDCTEELCRDLAAADGRVLYHRQPANVGLLANFIQTMKLASGDYFRWIGDDDSLDPTYISRCMDTFRADGRLILVTTQLQYVRPDGSVFASPSAEGMFDSDDPIERYERYVACLIDAVLPVDPLYGLIRRADVAAIQRRNTIREDEVFAGNLVLAGPWGHVPEVLGTRHLRTQRLADTARYLGVPSWQAYVARSVQCREMLRGLRTASLTDLQRRRASRAVGRLFVLGGYRSLLRRARRLAGKSPW